VLFLLPSLSLSPFSHRLPLHSCPTRRSSDLWITSTSGCCVTASTAARAGRWSIAASTAPRSAPAGKRSSIRRWTVCRCCACWSRSEEHTSELQSRENLVCRLLLEKKNHLSTL